MELLPEHFSKLDEMSTLLHISEDCTIAFIRCNEPILRDELYKEIIQRVGDEIFIYNIEMDENSINLLKLLNEAVTSELYDLKIKDNKKVAFFVSGLDRAIETETQDGRREALIILNMMREEFLKIRHTIIIWINSASLSIVLKEAQDFFSWRTTVFEFDMARKEAGRPAMEFGETDLASLTKEELEERWKSYSGLLKEYQKKGIEDAHRFAYWNYNLGMIKLLKGHAAEALRYFEESIRFSEKIADREHIANSMGLLGNACSHLGQVDRAIKYYERALEISREIGYRKSEGVQLGNIGNVYRIRGETRKSIEYYEKALRIAQEIEDRRNEGIWLGNLGIDYRLMGEMEKAINYLENALKIAQEIRDKRNESRWLTDIGLVHRDLGSIKKAMEYYKKSLEIAQEIGDIRREGFLYGEFGFAYHYRSKVKKANKCYEKALKIARDIGDRSNESKWLGNLGKICHDSGKEKDAVEYYEKAIKIAQEIGNKRFEGRWLGNLGNAYSDLGQIEKAIEYYEKALAIGKEIKDPRIITFCEKNLAKLDKVEPNYKYK